MPRNAITILVSALVLSAAVSVEALNFGQVSSYVTRGLGPVLATAALEKKSHLQSRSLHKRDQTCSDDGYIRTYCTGTTFCAGSNWCINYIWLTVGIIAALIVICGCIRRCNRGTAPAGSQVVITAAAPEAQPHQPGMTYAVQPPAAYPATTYQPYATPVAAPAPYPAPSPAQPAPYYAGQQV
ncbi:hypothetical protein BGX26_005007 [Mortierella sp. AD094]|nr:hypothetical protein BGX26_005007 [Mortierella sp. AD094]